jgi:glycosyltransferase involved in cell wall biosynthesis
VEVLVFAPTAKEPAFQHNGTLISVPSVALPGRGEYRIATGLPAKQRKILEDFGPDIIHLAAPDWLGHAALKWAEDYNIPAVASFHTRFDTYPRYYHMAWLEKHVTRFMQKFYHRCERIYAPSQCMVDILTEQNMAKDIRIWTRGVDSRIFNPARRDHKWRRSLGIGDTDTVIAFCGRLVLEKGLGVFADVLDELGRRGMPYKALIIGEGPERENFTACLPDAIFLGYQKGTDLARAYASADIFFNASITETFGNVTLEAMASGLPSVCADASGSRFLVDEGNTGFLVEPDNINAYADKISLLITNTALRSRLARVATMKSGDFCWDKILGDLLKEYGEVVALKDAEMIESAHLMAAE